MSKALRRDPTLASERPMRRVDSKRLEGYSSFGATTWGNLRSEILYREHTTWKRRSSGKRKAELQSNDSSGK